MWSPDLTLRFFLNAPEQLEATILTLMKRDGAAELSRRAGQTSR